MEKKEAIETIIEATKGNARKEDFFKLPNEIISDVLDAYAKAINKNSVIPDVSLSCYLFKVDNEDCFVLGENIGDAIDRLEKEEPNAEYELVHSKSLDCIY